MKKYIFVTVIICLLFSCKKDEEEIIPVGTLTSKEIFGTWISTDDPKVTNVMLLLESNMWISDLKNILLIYQITGEDTVLAFDGTFEVRSGELKSYENNDIDRAFSNKILEFSANKMTIFSGTVADNNRVYTRTTSKLTPPADVDFSTFTFFGNNTLGPCQWTGFSAQQIAFNSTRTQILYTALKSGKRVYVGIEEISGVENKAFYMEDGVVTALKFSGSGSIYYDIRGIVVLNNDVYIPVNIGDTETYTSKGYSGYWKNGVWQLTEKPMIDIGGTLVPSVMMITGGCTDGTSLYISGYYTRTVSGISKACYWKDNERIDLVPPGNSDAVTTSGISYTGNSIYIGGSYSEFNEWSVYLNKGCYWKDGVPAKLEFEGSVEKVFVLADKTIIAGRDRYHYPLVFIDGIQFAPPSEELGSHSVPNFTSAGVKGDVYFFNAYELFAEKNPYVFFMIHKDLKHYRSGKIPFTTGIDENVVRVMEVQ